MYNVHFSYTFRTLYVRIKTIIYYDRFMIIISDYKMHLVVFDLSLMIERSFN